MSKPVFKRILLKLSGEALMGREDYGIDPTILKDLASEIINIAELGIEIGVVIGGGNIFRGAGLAKSGIDRATADHMGMLATVMNSLALQDALEKQGGDARVMSALKINEVCEDYIRRRALRHMEKKRIVIFAAGTGNPFFTTDSAAALRAVEMGAQILLKATKVDGLYTADPKLDPTATKYAHVSFDEVLNKKLAVMDATAIALCRDYKMPIRIYNMTAPGELRRLMFGAELGTLVN
jgi:uridylate kinase